MSKWVLEQIKPETSLEAKMTKPKLILLWAHYEKSGFLGKEQ